MVTSLGIAVPQPFDDEEEEEEDGSAAANAATTNARAARVENGRG